MQFKTKLWLFVVGAIALEALQVKAMAATGELVKLYDFDLVAVGALIFICLLGLIELFRHYSLKVEKLHDDLIHERQLKEAYEFALNDIVDNFGENGMNMHRSTLEKLNSLSRARSVLGRIKG